MSQSLPLFLPNLTSFRAQFSAKKKADTFCQLHHLAFPQILLNQDSFERKEEEKKQSCLRISLPCWMPTPRSITCSHSVFQLYFDLFRELACFIIAWILKARQDNNIA